MRYMQKYPVRSDIKRARPGDIQNYPDTRRDPIKRMKLEKVAGFLKENKLVYQDKVDFEIDSPINNQKVTDLIDALKKAKIKKSKSTLRGNSNEKEWTKSTNFVSKLV